MALIFRSNLDSVSAEDEGEDKEEEKSNAPRKSGVCEVNDEDNSD